MTAGVLGIAPSGCLGSHGSNDVGYMNFKIRAAAEEIQNAIYLYCQGHYPHSNARVIPTDDPLVLALAQLAIADQHTASWANREHDPALFAPYTPSEADQHRWDKYQGQPGLTPG